MRLREPFLPVGLDGEARRVEERHDEHRLVKGGRRCRVRTCWVRGDGCRDGRKGDMRSADSRMASLRGSLSEEMSIGRIQRYVKEEQGQHQAHRDTQRRGSYCRQISTCYDNHLRQYTIHRYCILGHMAHTIKDKEKLLNRARRIRGQATAIEKALEEERDCSAILQTIAACRGAINGLMAELIEGQIKHHVVDPARRPTAEQSRAAQEIVDIVKAYLR